MAGGYTKYNMRKDVFVVREGAVSTLEAAELPEPFVEHCLVIVDDRTLFLAGRASGGRDTQKAMMYRKDKRYVEL